ncbi:bifunctional YncE family protein/alkaline phosphatase family protein [Paenibacillus filicis]|uniref:Bifunctional YncE family protein/alkaline phosphatase family protein n=1 Tax=Paenibacillus gyeongsangnamensis TaxID=3388067 RepID=A0ABT4Q5M7_9BACL|nr:bifunctional YncE family protein/alkaline phosphatase family protein [Paenibacillus filicis]MCZ8512179.1 bifunctional YncE family protein/alkaline phosphatase family protein [Paenibacillus filicis]
MKIKKKKLISGILLTSLVLSSGTAFAFNSFPFPWGAQVDKFANGWTLTPAGEQVKLGDRPYGMTMSPDGQTLLISNNGQSTQSIMVVDRKSGKVIQTIPYKAPEALFLGVVYSPDGKKVYASGGGNNKIRVYDVQGQQLSETAPILMPATDANGKKMNTFPAGLAISSDGKTLYAANNLHDSMSIIDLPSGSVKKTIQVGHNPYLVTLSKDGATAYVSNWGGTTVSVIDTASAAVSGTIEVGAHPSAMRLNPVRNELYVANTDSDTVSVIDTAKNQVARTIELAPYKGAKEGSSPDALTVSPDGNSLYVANAGNNDVVVIRLAKDGEDNKQDKIEGMIPTAWYPTGIEVSQDGKQLYVANSKGYGAGPNPNGSNPYDKNPTPADQYSGSMEIGTLSIIDVPAANELAHYTKQVVGNNGFDERDKVRTVKGSNDQQVIPRHVGDPSPIKHVIYVVRENRTYDQVLGSLGKGNGDPNLNLFGEESAPNTRQLARQFVTLDNFFADGEVSSDGWNWTVAGMANTYVQKTWPANYSGRNRIKDTYADNISSIPNGNFENAYIWDRLAQNNISYRNYGFYAYPGYYLPSSLPGLIQHSDTAYPPYDMKVKDQVRVDEWLKEFKTYESNDNLPTVQLVRLPIDHTVGTSVGQPTPKAMMADNDLALGRLVDTVSKSKYWKDTAIFVVEDDAQDGSDHVDAHRTVALVISPYTQTGNVDSTHYTTTSMLRSMELIVGVPPLTQFDASALPMFNAFTDKPNFKTYDAITPKQSLDEVNKPNAPLAAESSAMDFSVEDRAPAQRLNLAIWQSVKGAGSQMPEVKSSIRSQKNSDNAGNAEAAEENGHLQINW